MNRREGGSGVGSACQPLDRLRALVLADVLLQEKLRATDDADHFVALVMDAARDLGVSIAAEGVRAAMRPRLPGMDALVDDEVGETALPPAGWLPVGTSWRRGELAVHWCYFGEQQLRDPFFEGSVQRCLFQPFNRLFRHTTPISRLAEWLRDHPPLRPSGLIFHMSRCGSTLVSQMLAASERNVVVSEASPIDAVVRARQMRPDLGEDEQARWLAWIVGALGQPRRGERRCFIKLDCWHTLALPLFRRAFPSVPWVFMYRDPVEVLVSQLRMPGAQMLAQGIGPDLYGLARSYGPGSAEDYYARVLAEVCKPVVRHHSEGGLLVDYRQLPDAVATAILPHFGVECSDADLAAMAQVTRYDAKTPSLQFAPDSGEKQQAATPAARAAADRWLGELYRRLETLRAGA